MNPSKHSAIQVQVQRWRADDCQHVNDWVAVERPLQIQVRVEGRQEAPDSVAITMRTPGQDPELALGFLTCEGVLMGTDVARVDQLDDDLVRVVLASGSHWDPNRLSRHVMTTSSCGMCGKASLDQIHKPSPLAASSLTITNGVLHHAAQRLKDAQTTFQKTGGLHAVALFDPSGDLLLVREDVGRHNAFDKVIGALHQQKALPARDIWALVSGRTSFELVHKALIAGMPLLASIGAPSSLAIETAAEYGMTLVGFLSDRSFNIYGASQRVSDTP